MNGTISDEEERSPGGSISWSSDFIVVEAELPATTALLAVYGSTSRWVVIRRHGGRHLYVFRDDEVSNHPALSRWLATHAGMADATLADVLDLHEHQESTPTATKVSVCGAAWEPLPQLVGKPNAADAGPSATRYVLMDAAGMPREVGVSAADARRARPPHRGAGAVREAAAEAAATEAVDISARDEGRSPIRHPAITPDAPPSPGRPISLSVDLKRQADPDTEGGAITFDAPADWTELRVRFQLVCPAIEFERATGEVIVKRNAASLPDVCRGTVRAGLAAGTSIDVTAVFLHDGRFSGTAVRRLVVGEAAAPPPPPTEGALLVEVGATPPDLTVQILVPDRSLPGRLLWLLQPRETFDSLPPALEESVDVGRDAAVYVTQLFKKYAQLERGKHQRAIEGFGDDLWRRAPACFRDTYWALWDRLQRPLTIQFVSAEPSIPWEIMRPSRRDEIHPILARKHPVARWISSYRSYMRHHLPAGGLFMIAPRYKSERLRLKRAEAEVAALAELGAKPIPATYEAVLAFLEAASPPEPVALLYFAGHGSFAADAVDASTIKLEDGSLAVTEVDREDIRLGVACRTLVFFNACEVGATGSALGAVGGWADAFLGRRFGGFIAPLWSVDDDDAATVSAELLRGIVQRGEPIGAVLRDVREKYGDVSPTFYSYLYYGDVNARLGSPR